MCACVCLCYIYICINVYIYIYKCIDRQSKMYWVGASPAAPL